MKKAKTRKKPTAPRRFRGAPSKSSPKRKKKRSAPEVVWRFDEKRARRAVAFIENLEHIKGEWRGTKLRLRPWEKKIVRDIFGWVDEKGFRKYRTVYIEVPRKNGKTTIASAIGLYLLAGDDEPGAEVYSAAVDTDEAKLTFTPAKEMVAKIPALARRLEVFESSLRIVYQETGSFWQVIPGKVPGNWGLNAHGILFDEIHAQPNSDLWDALTTSITVRRQPLIVAITTAGWDKHSLCWRLHQRAVRAIRNPDSDPTFYGVIFAAGEKDDWKLERTWKKANPNYGVSIKPAYFRGELKRALEEPTYENTFKRLHLNIWTQQATRYIPMETWYKLPKPEEGFANNMKRLAFGGLDLSTIQDISSYALLFIPTPELPFWDLKIWFFCPEARIEYRSRKDRVPYEEWARSGLLIATPGNAIDFDFVEGIVLQSKTQHKIARIGYDRWGATQISQHLDSAHIEVIPVNMNYSGLSAATKMLLQLILAGTFRHGDHPILNWMADNLAVKTDPSGNVKPAKDASAEKIDGIVAVVCALAAYINTDISKLKKESVYRTRGALQFNATTGDIVGGGGGSATV